jgi:cold-inducible RNA-binding protein
MASIPEPVFEEKVAEAKQAGELTTAGMLRVAKGCPSRPRRVQCPGHLGLVNGSAVASASSQTFPYPLVSPSSFLGAKLPHWGTVSPFFLREAHMGKKLYVGNLTYGVTDATLEQMFAAHGTVQSAQVIMDRDTGRSKGFGFVEMGSDQEAKAAIAALNGQQVEGRNLTVNEAKPREDRGGGGRGGFGGGGGRRY